MRLTLRTLLAWLDDTLPPSEVREIGRQVSESEFAKDLVDRIRRVTRQRRLTVPARSGPDAVDPNLVASYLDNELAPEQVAEYEKLCLTSDVNLAEVASTHQVLSLIGQKAKVPPEARRRMYHLIKGREAVVPREPEPASDLADGSEPIQPWVTPVPPRRPWIERYGPTAAVVAMIGLLVWSAYLSLTPPRQSTSIARRTPPDAKTPTPGSPKPAESAPEKPAPSKPAEPAKTAPPVIIPQPIVSPKPDLPSGIVGVAENPAGVLLRYNPDQRQWEQLTKETMLKDRDRLLNLDPFRSALLLGGARVELVGETEVWVQGALPTQAARFNLVQGRVDLHGTVPAAPFAIQSSGRPIEITPPANVPVGLERVARREPGTSTAASPVLVVFAPEGEVALAAGDARETLAGPGAMTFRGGSWVDKEAKPAPSWVTEPKPSALAQQIGAQFARYFRPERPVIANLAEAMDDEQKDVSRLAISALRAAGDLSMIVPILSTPEDPARRRAAIGVLRAALDQGPDTLRSLREEFHNTYGPDLGATMEKLLIGYTSREAHEDTTFRNLVDLLSNEDVGARELALDNLRVLTGRDDLGYDPDKPLGPGLKAWKDLLRDHELRPVAAKKPEKAS